MVQNCRCHRQPASASDGRSVETFLWDGLALIRRDGTNIVNEPAVTGGNPVVAGDKTLFNDMLGSTLGAKSGGEFSVIERDAFGQTETASDHDFFTGKPHVGELGYAFLFRNYRANLGKWQTADPMGYPDGWNNLAYVNNNVTKYIDFLGGYKLGNGAISDKAPGDYSKTGDSYSVGGFLFFQTGYLDEGLCMFFSVDDETNPYGWQEAFFYTVNDDGSVEIPSICSGAVFSGKLYNEDPFNEFVFSATIVVIYYVISETEYIGNKTITKYYGNIRYSVSSLDLEFCNVNESPHKPILLNTVTE